MIKKMAVARVEDNESEDQIRYIDIVFTAPPGPDGECVFVEVENDRGRSVCIGEWIRRDDGYHVLRLTPESINAVTS